MESKKPSKPKKKSKHLPTRIPKPGTKVFRASSPPPSKIPKPFVHNKEKKERSKKKYKKSEEKYPGKTSPSKVEKIDSINKINLSVTANLPDLSSFKVPRAKQDDDQKLSPTIKSLSQTADLSNLLSRSRVRFAKKCLVFVCINSRSPIIESLKTSGYRLHCYCEDHQRSFAAGMDENIDECRGVFEPAPLDKKPIKSNLKKNYSQGELNINQNLIKSSLDDLDTNDNFE